MSAKKIDRRSFIKSAALAATALGVTGPVSGQPDSVSKTLAMKQLGSSGIKIPIMHLGTAQNMDPVYDKVMHLCFREGVTMIDTALNYGWGASHKAVRQFLQQMGDRKKVFIASKSGSAWLWGLRKGLNECLEDMETDYLDLFMMHNATDPAMLEPDFIKLGDELRKSGKTKLFGFSCHGKNIVPVMNKAAKVGGIDAILFRYNFRQYGDLELNRAIDACKKAGIGLLAMKSMGSVPEELEQVVEFRSRNFTLPQAKLKSIWADERIDSINSEMSNIQQVRENVAAARSEMDLTSQESHQLNRLSALTSKYYCNGCANLCEKAIEYKTAIADPLRFLMYYECYDKQDRARELYQEIPVKLRGFDSIRMAQASATCPQGIDIASRLAKAARVLA